jgi:hypothetical protein
LKKKPVVPIEESRQYIENIQIQYIQNGVGRFAVILKETDEFMAGLIEVQYEPDKQSS